VELDEVYPRVMPWLPLSSLLTFGTKEQVVCYFFKAQQGFDHPFMVDSIKK
jgi:hypothetical protein